AAAVVCLVLGGISLRREGGGITFVLGGGFSKWMFWCVVFLTLQPLLIWFSSFGVAVPLPGGGISTSWLAALESDITNFVNNFILEKRSQHWPPISCCGRSWTGIGGTVSAFIDSGTLF